MTDNAESEPERVFFSGTGSEDATLLIRHVQTVAIAKGYQSHDTWRALYLVTCLRGAAMRWYFRLSDDILHAWVPLCRCLLHAFPPPTVPAPAVTSSPIGSHSSPNDSIASPALQGRLKIFISGEYFGYVAREMSKLNQYQVLSKDAGKALIVEIPPEDQLGCARWNIKLINPIPLDSECIYLGLVDRDDTHGKATFMVQCSSDDPSMSSDCAITRAWGIRNGQELFASRTSKDHSLMVLHGNIGSRWQAGAHRLTFSQYQTGPITELFFEPI
ncbi:hypothetical protein FRB93_010980 [Tulasnella sp. JGI-2019a]|nr:hypothetical protein FRB93_010980 [Tulasnella sp. JGI-2019a]